MMRAIRMQKHVFLLILGSILFLSGYVHPHFSEETGLSRMILNEGWKFRQAGKESWFPAAVPGCVHLDLLDNGLIEDPFYRDSEMRLQWIGKSDWEYQVSFLITMDQMRQDQIELIFRGLDTYAAVYLNADLVLQTDNMFREWRIPCKEYLHTGENRLRVCFRSPINEILPVMQAMSYQLPASNDQGEKTSPFTRKAPYHFGWDWGPRYVTCGVWQPVYFEFWNEAKIGDFHIRQNHVDAENAELTAVLEIEASKEGSASIVVMDDGRSFRVLQSEVLLKKGKNTFSFPVTIKKPKLWWPNGLGGQPLTAFHSRLMMGGKLIDRAVRRIGLRSAELRQEPDSWGKSFMFVVNGIPVFAKGGNWIPADNFVTRISHEKYRHLLQSCRDANMNMLRVWGGGIYEQDEFYDLCDELGILVWQDFMFACSMYPGDQGFLDTVQEEAVYQVRRLRNHPSLVLWCGNNEIETAWFHWGWKEAVPSGVWDDYRAIFHEILPSVCSAYDPGRYYWPSSPSSNLEADANDPGMGDGHYWGVWHAALPFEAYEEQFHRFQSEYGFQSFPEMKTVQTYTLPQDRDIESSVMLAHQKHPRGNQLIREYMLRHFPKPKDFPSFLYLSQVLQAEGIKIGAEHFRRIMPRCMGSLYWQINDCWPVASWSSIDYFGRWKALQYYARRFYSPVLVSTHEVDGEIQVTIISDRIEPIQARLHCTLMDFDGNIQREETLPVTIAPLQSQVLDRFQKEDWLQGQDPKKVFLFLEVRKGKESLSSNTLFFEPMKDLPLPKPAIDSRIIPRGGGFQIILSADQLARGVYLSTEKAEGFFSDNYFDLIPGNDKMLTFLPAEKISREQFIGDLHIISLVEAFVPSS
jgi:beta-mannosidase